MDNNLKRPDKKDGDKSKIKTIILYAVMLAVFIGGIAFIGSRRSQGDKAAYYQIVQYFEQGKVTEYNLNLSNGKLTFMLSGEKEAKIIPCRMSVCLLMTFMRASLNTMSKIPISRLRRIMRRGVTVPFGSVCSRQWR